MIVLETRRLTLRRLVPQDLDALSALYRDPEMRRYFPDGTLTREKTQREIEWFEHGHPDHPELGLWAAIERSSGRLLGRCGLLPWDIDGRHEVELAYLIDKSRWGEGLGTEAAVAIAQHARTVLGIERLICLITPGNQASVRVAQHVGMTFERELLDEHGLCHVYASTRAAGGRAPCHP